MYRSPDGKDVWKLSAFFFSFVGCQSQPEQVGPTIPALHLTVRLKGRGTHCGTEGAGSYTLHPHVVTQRSKSTSIDTLCHPLTHKQPQFTQVCMLRLLFKLVLGTHFLPP